MNAYAMTISSAIFCVLSRVVLNIFDRNFFRKEDVDFLHGVFFNALYPLGFSFVNCLLFSNFDLGFLTLFINPGVILSGIGAQFTAYSASKCLSQMNIRNVMVTSKTSDFFIPIGVFFITNQFNFNDYLFVVLTSFAFLPIAFTIFKEGKLYEATSYLFMGSLLCQALINSYFHMSDYAQSWSAFSQLMVGILFWRAIVMCVSVLTRKFNQQKQSFQLLNISILVTLFIRGALAFLSQAAFFFSITREKGFIAWPILNAAPILSCYAAHHFLKEKAGRPEMQVLLLFIFVFCSYFLIKGGYLW